MKLPAWVIGIVSTIFTAACIGGFAWAWNLNAATATNKATVEALNMRVIDNKENTNKDIKALVDAITILTNDNKEAHKEIKEMLYRISRRSGNGGHE